VEGPPAGRSGEGGSSPELLGDGKGWKNRDGGGVLRQGGCFGGRRGPTSRWEGRGGSGPAIPGEKGSKGGGARGSAHRGVGHDGGGGRSSDNRAAPHGELLHKWGKVVRGGRHGRLEQRAAAYRGEAATASDRGGQNAGGANGMPSVADIATDVWAPHVSRK
jgi:hypothetical protein